MSHVSWLTTLHPPFPRAPHPTKPQARRITEEFVNQYAAEVANDLTPTTMWANAHTDLGLYKSQVGFIQFIVSPMWTVIMDFFPEFNTEGGLVDVLNSNKARWQEKVMEETARLEGLNKKADSAAGSHQADTTTRTRKPLGQGEQKA